MGLPNSDVKALTLDDVSPGERADAQIALNNPGYAGVWFDTATKSFVLNVVRGAETAATRAAAVAMLTERFPGAELPSVDIRTVEYSFVELATWRNSLRRLFTDPEVVGLDLDERENRVVISRTKLLDPDQLGKLATSVGAPAQALRVELGSAPIPQVLLTDKRRPQIENGFKMEYDADPIHIGNCTLGADVIAPGLKKGFVAASHCSYSPSTTTPASPGSGMNGTDIWQNLCCGSNKIADEAIDPPRFTGGYCPPGASCRYSDALWADYTSDTYYSGKKVAETTSVGSGSTFGSTTLKSVRPATISSSLAAGLTARKTGQISGTTQGVVHATCKDEQYSVSPLIWLLCQDEVDAPSSKGDSGSPVYLGFNYGDSTAAVYHAGILWAGQCVPGPTCSVTTRFVSSPWSGIAWDLGVNY